MRAFLIVAWMSAAFGATSAIEFNRDVRPILSDKCFTCHGPDQANRKSKLRLDTEAGATYLDKKIIVDRIRSTNPALRMPPTYASKTLSEAERTILEQWVAEGTRWEKHWSLVPPKASGPRDSIDQFVVARLQKEGLKPSPSADAASLIRRVSFDLTGLPPTPAEVNAFLADKDPQAYAKLVDRLLRSPRYGERMAIRWLDAARYADTNGYQSDGERNMWRWRDWVIEAFNTNKPYNDFLTEQLAGDLIPNARRSQVIATGFNRNHRGNSEGGIIPEEYAVEYVVDRIDTASTVFLGLTFGCARCHDHKYDPLTQKEYYQLYAFFNNIGEWGRYIKYGNTPPYIPSPTPEQERQLASWEARLIPAEQKLLQAAPAMKEAERTWAAMAHPAITWAPSRALQVHLPLPASEGQFDGKRRHDGGLQTAAFGYLDKFTVALSMKADAPSGAIFSRGKDVSEEIGYGLHMVDGKLQFHMTQRWLDDGLRVETEQPLTLHQWHQVTISYDATRLASGVKIYVDGKQQKLKTLLDMLNQSFFTASAFFVGGGAGTRFTGEIHDVRVFTTALYDNELMALTCSETVNEIALLSEANRTPAQQAKLSTYFMDKAASPELSKVWQTAFDLREEGIKLKESLPSVMVMQELPDRPDTHVLVRGAYDHPGAKVDRGVPASLPPLPPGAPMNRLGFAQWLTDPQHPLTSRVAVNRFWQMIFGTGIVKTVDDFGSQGEWPSHPELLDFLATEFIRSGWDVKGLLKTMVMSSTYQQSSRSSEQGIVSDPENRLMGRGPRQRLSAEMLRDQALYISGLMVEKQGGPSAKPYQPAGLWKELSNDGDYKPDTGEGLYRRSLYTFWKRTIPPPFMMNFDSAGREACTVRETRTNTPLQALNLMNDVTYLEASRKIAEKMMVEGGSTAGSRIGFAFQLATARNPSSKELAILEANFQRALDRYQTKPADAQAMLKQGDSPVKPGLKMEELAAYAHVASLILNLDEVVSKE